MWSIWGLGGIAGCLVSADPRQSPQAQQSSDATESSRNIVGALQDCFVLNLTKKGLVCECKTEYARFLELANRESTSGAASDVATCRQLITADRSSALFKAELNAHLTGVGQG